MDRERHRHISEVVAEAVQETRRVMVHFALEAGAVRSKLAQLMGRSRQRIEAMDQQGRKVLEQHGDRHRDADPE